MKYLVLDTETTGLDPNKNRVVEFAAVPIHGLTPSMDTYQQYFNPEMDMPAEAYAVHGLSTKFLKDFPPFSIKAKEIREYLEGSILIIHNAQFDLKFLNTEFKRCNIPTLTNQVIDTLQLARSKYPGKRASLDALCSRFNIALDERTSKGHGALLDSQLLCSVYLKMITESTNLDLNTKQNTNNKQQTFQTNLTVKVSDQEKTERTKFTGNL